MSLWLIGYFESKVLEKQQMQKGSSDPPTPYGRKKTPIYKVLPLCQEEEKTFLAPEKEEPRSKEICEGKYQPIDFSFLITFPQLTSLAQATFS